MESVFIFFFFVRKLNQRQQDLMLSYAKEETDVEGSVNGVTRATPGTANAHADQDAGCRNGLRNYVMHPNKPSFVSIYIYIYICVCVASSQHAAKESGVDPRSDEEQPEKDEGGFFSKLKKMFS